MGDAARRFFQTTRPNNTVARIVDATIQTCIDRPTASSKWIDLMPRNPRSTQWCVVGITNKANKKKFAYRIALTMARERIGDAAFMTAPPTSIAALRVCVSQLTKPDYAQKLTPLNPVCRFRWRASRVENATSNSLSADRVINLKGAPCFSHGVAEAGLYSTIEGDSIPLRFQMDDGSQWNVSAVYIQETLERQ
jgi:hypothetical protein